MGRQISKGLTYGCHGVRKKDEAGLRLCRDGTVLDRQAVPTTKKDEACLSIAGRLSSALSGLIFCSDECHSC